MNRVKLCKQLDENDWEDALCPVCMESPHNAVLLLCSSHDNGCRPYMCGTSYHFSNCLEQFQKAQAKIPPPCQPSHFHGVIYHGSSESPSLGAAATGRSRSRCEVTELACPLCRGPVKGWTIVEAARACLNASKRSCMQNNCAFIGTFEELQKHVEVVHPSALPRKVDPLLEHKWKMFEHERELEDVISTIRSSMPGAVIVGDFVIDMGPTIQVWRMIKTGIIWCIKMTGIGIVCYYSCKCFGRLATPA